MTFAKVLVANRGEIAARIIRTLRQMGIASVAAYSDADVGTAPVAAADEAVRLGPASSYLDADAIINAALASKAEAVHPGYGFLAERGEFAERVEAAGLVFIGPTPAQLHLFGAKHEARALAEAAGVPLLPASALVSHVDDAVAAAEAVGFPLLIKATAGGGGIGMRICRDGTQLAAEFDGAHRQAAAAFGDGRVYLERYLAAARHVEVQIVGDGTGRVVTLGDRDCSLQRRHQKVIEEAPAPALRAAMREELHRCASRLAESVAYRSVGTVEFLVEASTGTVAFLEVNARLQVEHTVTEEVYGIDLVEWMVRIAAGDTAVVDSDPQPSGHAIEARLCAESPWRDHQPSAGTLSAVSFPSDARVDTWVEAGTEVTTHYDSLLAKVIVHGRTRDEAVARLAIALDGTRIDGVATNLDLLRAVAVNEEFCGAALSTSLLGTVQPAGRVIEVLAGGTQTTVQDYPGRLGLWAVGVPPCGPMDDLSFRVGNRALGNPEGTAGLELTAQGPRLLFHAPATLCIAGAPCAVDIDGAAVPMWEPVAVTKGAVVTVGAIGPPGIRAYLLLSGGIDESDVLGSKATFTLGGFGGHAGRTLRVGDILHMATETAGQRQPTTPTPITSEWRIEVLEGPHQGYLAPAGLDAFYDAEWRVHHNSARTGVRLIGPTPEWSRPDGGEAGLHPSNIHDTPYAVGAVDLTGDMPILLGPDGPSLGGFVCPAVVTSDNRWKVGQLRPDDTVRFVPRSREGSHDAWEADGDRPAVSWLRSGDDYMLVEYGPMVLDLALRFRVHALQQWMEAHRLDGVIDITPGVRSLQVHFDPDRLPESAVLEALQAAELELPAAADTVVESRVVHLPLSWDDPATREAIDRYMSTVRADAPWCPWNIEFIRRINGLDSVDDVHRIVFDASYLVLGLGDVYLGAPVATPLDPRHRLVTTKYNPARTWTPENAVGIGGAYLCIYGMEGPGGYQFVGRTVPVWNRFRRTAAFTEPWLLRFFDQLRFFEVSAAELLDWRRDLLTGRAELQMETTTLALADSQSDEIDAFRRKQQAAFNEERARWAAMPTAAPAEAAPEEELPFGATLVETAILASVWKVVVAPGQYVVEGDVVVVLESMKMEMAIHSPVSGTVARVMVRPGQDVVPGQALLAVKTT